MVHLQNLQDGVQDTSRSGTYHNKKFKEAAEAHGLTVEKGEKYGWHKTTLNPEALEFVQSLGKQGFTLVRPRPLGLKGSSKGGDQVPGSMFALVVGPLSEPPKKSVLSVRIVTVNFRRNIEMRRKRKTVWAFLDGKKLVDVVQAALDNNMMVDDLKAKLIAENPGHEVTFKAV